MSYMSDIEIAQEATPRLIQEIAAKLSIEEADTCNGH